MIYQALGSLLLIGLVLIGFCLSAWIILIAPTEFWLPLSVGAPEVSPWLILLNIVALFLALLGKRQGWSLALIGCSSCALLLSSWPLIQLPGTIHSTQVAMEQGLGAQSLEQLAKQQPSLRPHPYSITDSFFGIPSPPVRQLSNIPFAAPDGHQLSLEIFQPAQPGIYPGLIVIYGGAWRRGEPTANADFNRYIAAQGYVVWAIDYRHAPEYRFPRQLEDVQTALKFIEEKGPEYETDPQHLVLMGRSAGAQLAMLAAYREDNPAIQGVINYYGPVNLTAGYTNPPQPDPISTRTVLKDFLGGSPDQYPEAYRQASPFTYVVRPQPATLLIYGGRDHIVKAQYGQHLYQQLLKVGSPAVYLEIPWADHAFDAVFNGVSNQLALYHTERFLAAVLQDDR